MDLGLEHRVALVTGSSRGIGRATAVLLGAERARVVVTYHADRTSAEATARAVEAAGGEALVQPFDLASAGSIGACVDAAVARWGRLDILVNNAVRWIPVHETPVRNFEEWAPDEWMPLFRTNIEGTYAAIQAVLPHMRQQRWGRIINVSSIAAADGMSGFGWYAAAKSALHGLTVTLSKELGPAGILVNVVMPGATATEQVLTNLSLRVRERYAVQLPIQRLPEPQEVATAIVLLASAVNNVITGEVIRASGGRA